MPNYMRRFVTAVTRDTREVRQGVVIGQTAAGVTVKGESGTIYECQPDPQIVRLRDTFGDTKRFAMREGVTE